MERDLQVRDAYKHRRTVEAYMEWNENVYKAVQGQIDAELAR